MITHRFVTQSHTDAEKPLFARVCFGDQLSETVFIPIELRMHYSDVEKEGYERLLVRIATALDKMVRELNNGVAQAQAADQGG